MKAADLKCPLCGVLGFLDVADDYDFGGDGLFGSVSQSVAQATCRSGHPVWVVWRRDPLNPDGVTEARARRGGPAT